MWALDVPRCGSKLLWAVRAIQTPSVVGNCATITNRESTVHHHAEGRR